MQLRHQLLMAMGHGHVDESTQPILPMIWHFLQLFTVSSPEVAIV